MVFFFSARARDNCLSLWGGLTVVGEEHRKGSADGSLVVGQDVVRGCGAEEARWERGSREWENGAALVLEGPGCL